jgi:peptidoglycan DL-endopeptidase CwlO
MKGVSGTAVALAAAGGLLLYDGIRGVSIPAALRSLITSGVLPAPPPTAAGSSPATGAAAVGQGGNPAIAQDALQYAGKVPYRWGGADPSGWDCSGFATWVLAHDLGHTNLPSGSHTVCMQFLAWSGAQRIVSAEPGALVVWPTHMGIAISDTEMISALNPSRGTVVTTFRDGGPVPWSSPTFLRVL